MAEAIVLDVKIAEAGDKGADVLDAAQGRSSMPVTFEVSSVPSVSRQLSSFRMSRLERAEFARGRYYIIYAWQA